MGRYKLQLVGDEHFQHLIERLEVGAPVKLLADPDNPKDPRAVKAMHKGETVGYVERDSWLIRAMHDDRTQVASRIDQIIAGEPAGLKVIVLDVRTGEDAEEALRQSQSGPNSPAAALAKKRGCGFWTLVAVAVIVGLAIVGAIFGPSKQQIAAQKAKKTAEVAYTATDVTATQLWAAYNQNVAAAQQAYGDRALRVTGRVDKVQLDFSDKPFVTLRTGNMFQSVHLEFANPNDPAITALRTGNQVTAICTSVSEVIGTPILKDCALQ